jgi:hypothetical protein
MTAIRNTSKLLMLILIVMISAFGCKGKKKAMEAANAEKEKARVEQEAALRKQQEEAKQREAEEAARREEEARRKENESKTSTPRTKLGQYFAAISTSSNTTAANNSINEALTMFTSPDTPVLIVISESAGVKDYDRPTTIKDYLNYLKDQKKNINAISDMKVDASGKITELELKKN